MKNATSSRPMAPATMLRFTESRPSVGSTRDDWITSSGTGSEPDFSWIASSFADFVVKLPSMIPVPVLKTVWMTGAETSLPSSVICTGWLR